jgi:hypothetical protein
MSARNLRKFSDAAPNTSTVSALTVCVGAVLKVR